MNPGNTITSASDFSIIQVLERHFRQTSHLWEECKVLLQLIRNCWEHRAQFLHGSPVAVLLLEYPDLPSDLQKVLFDAGYFKTSAMWWVLHSMRWQLIDNTLTGFFFSHFFIWEKKWLGYESLVFLCNLAVCISWTRLLLWSRMLPFEPSYAERTIFRLNVRKGASYIRQNVHIVFPCICINWMRRKVVGLLSVFPDNMSFELSRLLVI